MSLSFSWDNSQSWDNNLKLTTDGNLFLFIFSGKNKLPSDSSWDDTEKLKEAKKKHINHKEMATKSYIVLDSFSLVLLCFITTCTQFSLPEAHLRSLTPHSQAF